MESALLLADSISLSNMSLVPIKSFQLEKWESNFQRKTGGNCHRKGKIIRDLSNYKSKYVYKHFSIDLHQNFGPLKVETHMADHLFVAAAAGEDSKPKLWGKSRSSKIPTKQSSRSSDPSSWTQICDSLLWLQGGSVLSALCLWVQPVLKNPKFLSWVFSFKYRTYIS